MAFAPEHRITKIASTTLQQPHIRVEKNTETLLCFSSSAHDLGAIHTIIRGGKSREGELGLLLPADY